MRDIKAGDVIFDGPEIKGTIVSTNVEKDDCYWTDAHGESRLNSLSLIEGLFKIRPLTKLERALK